MLRSDRQIPTWLSVRAARSNSSPHTRRGTALNSTVSRAIGILENMLMDRFRPFRSLLTVGIFFALTTALLLAQATPLNTSMRASVGGAYSGVKSTGSLALSSAGAALTLPTSFLIFQPTTSWQSSTTAPATAFLPWCSTRTQNSLPLTHRSSANAPTASRNRNTSWLSLSTRPNPSMLS